MFLFFTLILSILSISVGASGGNASDGGIMFGIGMIIAIIFITLVQYMDEDIDEVPNPIHMLIDDYNKLFNK